MTYILLFRSLFYYRGDTLFKVRVGDYKAHLYTVGTPPDARMMGYDYCPGESVENVTTKDVIDHTQKPLLFHLGRDPGEKYIIRSGQVLSLPINKSGHQHTSILSIFHPKFSNIC